MLLQQDVLVVDQVTSFMSNDFAIYDRAGQVVGQIRTEGGLGSRMLIGSRQFTVFDTDGQPVLQIYDSPNFGLDKFELADGAGQPIGRVVKQFSFFSKRLTLEVAGGQYLDLKGDWFDFSFEITGPEGVVATVSRSWPGVAGGLLGRSRFVVAFNRSATPQVRRAVLGAVVAVDLIRATATRGRSRPAGPG